MKKNKLSLFAVLTLATAIAFNSCEKIEEGSPITIDTTSKKATISGIVRADLMLDEQVFNDNIGNTNFGHVDTLEYAPEGTEIHFHVKKQDFNPDVEDGSDEFRYSTTVNADGTYSIEIPTTEEGLNVDISFDDFEYGYKSWEVYDTVVNVISIFVDTTVNPNVIDTIFDNPDYLYNSQSTRVVFSRGGSSVEVHEDENVIRDFNY